MNTRCFFGLFLLLAGLTWVVDFFAWRTAGLARFVGRQSGILQPIDDMVGSALSDYTKTQRLRGNLDLAKTPAEIAKASKALADHLSGLPQNGEQLQLLTEIVQKYGRIHDPSVQKLTDLLAKQYASNGDKALLLPLLELLRDHAFASPPDERIAQDIVSKAATCGLDAFLVTTATRAADYATFSASARLAIVSEALGYFEKKRDAMRQADFAKRREALLGKAEVEKIFITRTARLTDRLKDKDFAAAVNDYDAMVRDLPQLQPKFVPLLCQMALAASGGTDPAPLLEVWKRLQAFSSPPDDTALQQDFALAARKSLGLLAKQTTSDAALLVLEAYRKIATANAEFLHFVEGETWVLRGKQGPSPKTLHVIPYRPDAGIQPDGRLDEPAWKDIPPLPGPFWASLADTEPEPREAGALRMEAKILYDQENLCFGIFVPEPFPSELQLIRPAGDDPSSWMDDCLEFFINAERRPDDYHQFLFTPHGAFHHYSNGQHTGTARESYPYPAAAMIGEKGYVVELKIPLIQLDIHARPTGKLMNGNLRRNRYLSPNMIKEAGAAVPANTRQNLSWSRMSGGSHHPDFFDFWQFE